MLNIISRTLPLILGLIFHQNSFASDSKEVKDKLDIGYLDHPSAFKLIPIIKKSYEDIGIKVSFLPLSATKRLEYANYGTTDGVLITQESNQLLFPNLHKIDTPIVNITFSLLCNNQSTCDPKSIMDENSNLYISRGGARVIANELKIQLPKDFKVIESEGQLINIVRETENSRIIQATRINGEKLFNIEGVQDTVLGTYSVYHFVNKMHKSISEDLALSISRNLKEAEESR